MIHSLNKNVRVSIVITFFIFSTPAQGQWHDKFSSRFRLGIHSGTSSFRGDLGSNNLGLPISSVNLNEFMGPSFGFGAQIHYQMNNYSFLRLHYLNSKLQGVREDQWTVFIGALSFESKINDFDLTFGFNVLKLIGIKDVYRYNEFVENIELSLLTSLGYGYGSPTLSKNFTTHTTVSYAAIFGDLGYEIAYLIMPNLGVSIGGRLRLYNSDIVDGYASGDNFDALWYHSIGVIVGFGGRGYARVF